MGIMRQESAGRFYFTDLEVLGVWFGWKREDALM